MPIASIEMDSPEYAGSMMIRPFTVEIQNNDPIEDFPPGRIGMDRVMAVAFNRDSDISGESNVVAEYDMEREGIVLYGGGAQDGGLTIADGESATLKGFAFGKG